MSIFCYISDIHLSKFLNRLLNYLLLCFLFFNLRFFRNDLIYFLLLLLLRLKVRFYFTLFFNLLLLIITLGWLHFFSGSSVTLSWFHFFSWSILLSENVSPIYLTARHTIYWLITFLHLLSSWLIASGCCFG